MAARVPLVVGSDGFPQELQSGDNLNAATTGVDVVSALNANASTAPPGSPVYYSSGTQFDLARANASGTVKCAGLLRASTATTASGEVQTDGIITLTTAEWDAVTGQTGGLTQGAFYFLSAATAGRMTTTAPTGSGEFIKPLGLAKSTTEFEITIIPGAIKRA